MRSHLRDEKLYAVVARSTFGSQNVQNTPCSKLRCRKSARRCGAKHIFKSKVQKTDGHGALLDCFIWQAQGVVHLVKSEQNVRVSWKFQLQPPLHYITLHSTTLHLPLPLPLPLHYITLHYTNYTLRSIPLHSTPLHYYNYNYNYNYNCTTFHFTTLPYTQLHHTTLQLQLQLQLHYATLITLHYPTQH